MHNDSLLSVSVGSFKVFSSHDTIGLVLKDELHEIYKFDRHTNIQVNINIKEYMY